MPKFSQFTTGNIIALIVIGLFAGFLSGLFGVGGGILIVPALVFALGFSQRIAAGTSLAAILPISLFGVMSYALTGNIDYTAGLLLAAGIIAGAQVGSRLLGRVSERFLQWFFVVFLLVVIVQLFVVIPSRAAAITYTAWTIAGLITTGFGTGILAALLGVGGGIVVVPALILLFGASDLVAKGSSLLMMIPGTLSGTWANARRDLVNLPAAAVIGVAACFTTTLGAWVARLVDPQVSNVLFAIFLVGIVARMVWQIRRRPGAGAQ